MTTTTELAPHIAAVKRLERLVNTNSGASRAAASVLLYAWNSGHPIRDLWTLDRANFEAALNVIAATYQGELYNGGDEIERQCTSLDMPKLARRYGKNGTHWTKDD